MASGHSLPRDTRPAWEETAQPRERELAFAQDEGRLPWLDNDDDAHSAQRVDSGRLIGFSLLGLVVLALLLGALWWVLNDDTIAGPEPDGSTIAAPEGPYKTRPADPGGKVHQGTGDTSFAVGEGQVRESRLASQPDIEPPAASPATVPSPQQAAATPANAAPAPAPQASGVGVQVGAYFSRAQAEEGWRTLTRQTEALAGVNHRVVQGQADIGTVFRLQAVAETPAAADSLCRALQDDGLACQVKR